MEYAHYYPKDYVKYIEGSEALEKQYLPDSIELDSEVQDSGLHDPIGDALRHVAPQLIHRYKNRVIFLPTLRCPITCRFCFRKNEINTEDKIFNEDFAQTLQYLEDHPEVNELIFTGGDPLVLSDSQLKDYLKQFARIEHIKFIRFHTRTPLVLPKRISSNFCDLLKSYQKRFEISLVLHCNHSDELNSQAREAITKLKPFRLLSQSVLLKGVNNDSQILRKLFLQLAEAQITPYYLHHPDRVKGAMHFWLPESEGLAIYARLKEELSGWMLPRYVIDSEKGTGKVQVIESGKY